jgi:hypothetical protein
LIRENLSSIKSFDENKDNRIDEAELGKATETAKEWASLAKKGNGGWAYFGKEGSVGPKDWNAIEEIAQKHPGVFISHIDSKYWLPAKIVLFAMERL